MNYKQLENFPYFKKKSLILTDRGYKRIEEIKRRRHGFNSYKHL